MFQKNHGETCAVFLEFKNMIRSVEILNCVNVPFKPLMLNNYSLSILVAMDNFLYFFVFFFGFYGFIKAKS